MRVGVALSGGGHRATAWGFGVLAALVETGLHRDVVSVSSVSGGSIANGVVAKAGDFRGLESSAAFADQLGSALRVMACEGLFFPGRRTQGYVATTLGSVAATALVGLGLVAGVLAAGRENGLVAYAIGGAVVGALAGWKVGRLLNRSRRQAAALALLGGVAGGSFAWVGPAVTTSLHGWRLATVLGLFAGGWAAIGWVSLVLLSRRGQAVESALGAGLLADERSGRPLALVDVARGVNHVFCTTDLESGDQFYLAPSFLYGFREGISVDGPAGVTLAAAVQASAALPGAFPPSIITTGPFIRAATVKVPESPPQRVVLTDGGVYDNMADQWESGLTRRIRVCPKLGDVQEPAQLLVVANASEAWDWRPFTAMGRVSRELLGLQRDQGVQYDVSTARRRADLVQRFRDNAKLGGLVGVIVMVDRSPLSLAAPFTGGTDKIARRATEAVTFLLRLHDQTAWDEITQRNTHIATTLGPIGAAAVLDLMEHAYTSTVVGLYVLHGIGRLVPFPRGLYESAVKRSTR